MLGWHLESLRAELCDLQHPLSLPLHLFSRYDIQTALCGAGAPICTLFPQTQELESLARDTTQSRCFCNHFQVTPQYSQCFRQLSFLTWRPRTSSSSASFCPPAAPFPVSQQSFSAMCWVLGRAAPVEMTYRGKKKKCLDNFRHAAILLIFLPPL